MGPTRVTLSYVTQRNIARMTNAHSESARLEQQAFSGLKVERASDASGEWVRIERLRSRRSDAETYTANAERAVGVLDAVDRALDDAGQEIKRAWELAVLSANETSGTNYQDAAAIELRSIRASMVSIANREFDGRSLFAGTAYDAPAFDDNGNYLGTTDVPTIRVSDNDVLAQGFDGSAVFQGTEDIFGLLSDVEAAMVANDADAIAGMLDRFERAHDQILLTRADAGSFQRRADDLSETQSSLELLLADLVDREVAADPIATYTQLNALRGTYEASVQVASKSIGKSLFDYIR
jgi:flagellar hook-associated protein 3 FlgL